MFKDKSKPAESVYQATPPPDKLPEQEPAASLEAPAKDRFESLWRTVTCILILIAFLALAFTGEIHPTVITLFAVAWAYSILQPRPPQWWREWMGRILTWLCLGAIAASIFLTRFDGVLYLLIFLGIYKCLTLRQPIDHLHSLIISFFMFLSCSIITNSVSFIVFMLLFIIFAILELFLYAIGIEAIKSRQGHADLRAKLSILRLYLSRQIFRRMIFTSFGISIFILVLAFGLFLIVPHYAHKSLKSPWSRSPLELNDPTGLSGYSDDLTLNNINRIELDQTPLMLVKARYLDENQNLPRLMDMRLRGMTLEVFDENSLRWSHNQQEITSQTWTEVNLNIPTAYRKPIIELEITQNLAIAKRLFGLPTPIKFLLQPQTGIQLTLDWPVALRVHDFGTVLRPNKIQQYRYQVQSILTPEASHLIQQLHLRRNKSPYRQQDKFSVASNITPHTAGGEQSESGLEPPWPMDPQLRMNVQDRALNTIVPNTPFGQKIIELSNTICSKLDSPGKIMQLTDWFHENFEYTIAPEIPRNVNPIEAFLWRTHKGHCEYFATSFAMLARAQGIPTRVAIGYYSSEFNLEQDSFIIRQSDAHAWVELWLDGLGWITIDPTPPESRGRSAAAAQKLLSSSLIQSVKSLWQRYILDYGEIQQQQFIEKMLNTTLGRQLHRLFKEYGGQERSPNNPGDGAGPNTNNLGVLMPFLLGGAVVLVGIMGLIIFYKVYKNMRLKSAELSLRRSPVVFMNHLIARLQALGWRRHPGQTPAEFLGEIDRQTECRWDLNQLVEIYYRTRFANQPITKEEENLVNIKIHSLQ